MLVPINWPFFSKSLIILCSDAYSIVFNHRQKNFKQTELSMKKRKKVICITS